MEGFDILNLIGNYAFPIVACIAMFWKINKQDSAHKEEMAKVAEAINNNTKALTELVVKLDNHLNAVYRNLMDGDDKR